MDAGYLTKESHSFHVELFLEVPFKKLKQEESASPPSPVCTDGVITIRTNGKQREKV